MVGMKITVIVATYNRPNALARVLEGLDDQSLPPDEVIVADDGSEAETAHLVKFMATKAAYRLHHVWQPDKGFRLAAIRNAALRISTGDYVVCLDGDCIPDRNFVFDHSRLAENECFFQGGRILVSRRLSECYDVVRTRSVHKLLGDLFRGNLGNGHHLLRFPQWPARYGRSLGGIRGCNMGFLKSDLYAVNGFNEDFVGWGREDSELAVRLFRYGLRCKRHPFMAVCFHLWHAENVRDRLAVNDALLGDALENPGHVCANGIEKLKSFDTSQPEDD
jgi:glycosyltransferase involved in cell wall biosynthesis